MADLGKSFQHERNSLKVYGSPGNQYGDTMVGGEDVKKINQMLQDAFAAGQAGAKRWCKSAPIKDGISLNKRRLTRYVSALMMMATPM